VELGYPRHAATVIPKSLEWKSYHQTSKSGPQGQALYSSLIDLQVLPESLIESIKCLGGPKLTENINTVQELLKTVPELGYLLWTRIPSVPVFRKISYFPDKELKVRVIAQLDY